MNITTGAKIQKIIEICSKKIQFLFIFLKYVTISNYLLFKNVFFNTINIHPKKGPALSLVPDVGAALVDVSEQAFAVVLLDYVR